MHVRGLVPAALVAAGVLCTSIAAQTTLPRLEKRGLVTQLIVDGKPFLALGGEIENDEVTNAKSMAAIWPALRSMHLNTVLVPVSWALIEPEEGRYDFTIVDELIDGARRHDLRLVPLWFGSWKNTLSSYAPAWVKRDFQRFPRVQRPNGAGTERLSPFSQANRDADARAFAALMRHIKTVDSERRTVIMVQVENEVGVIPDARDYSAAATAAFNAPVPRELVDYLGAHRDTLIPELRARWQVSGFRTNGTWRDLFGQDTGTDDLFMAWHFAKYIGVVAAAGKAEYAVPMFTNAALIRPNYAPGQYNSGGPLPHSMDLWRAAAPSIDFISPDIYFNFTEWTAKYAQSGNPLFIPEARAGAEGAVNAFNAIGLHAAIGFSPYFIELGAGPDNPLAATYDVLAQLSPLILEHQTSGKVTSVLLEPLTPSQRVTLGNYTMTVTPYRGQTGVHMVTLPPAPTSPPVGLVIATGPDEYVIAGAGIGVSFAPNTPGPPLAGLATVEHGRFENGRWVREYALAGDRTNQGAEVRLDPGTPTIQRVTLYRYQ
jgi:beta-galactosidase GanA